MWRALVLVTVVACTNQGERQGARWPDHRKVEEGRITALEEQVKVLTARLEVLEAARSAKTQVAPPAAPAAPDAIPEAIDRQMITEAIERVKAGLLECGTKLPSSKGVVKIRARVAPSGQVDEVTIEKTPDAALGDCVATIVRTATFAKTQQGGTFAYPFVY